MSEHGGKTSRPWDPQRSQQEAHSPASTLPEGALVFFLLDTVPQWDVHRLSAPYEQETRGAPPFDPAMRGCLLRYAYSVGGFSRRKIALAGERPLALLAIVGQERPDFRPSSDCRKWHVEACKDVFVQGGRLAGAAGLVQWGNGSTEGTNIQGNASRHTAMRYGEMKQAVERLREDIEALVTQAYQQDEAEDAALGSRRGDALPAELARREDRWARIAAARRRWEAQAKAAADAERKRRADAEAARHRTGKTRRGKAPQPVEDTPDDKAQSNLTDPARPSMRTTNKGWEDCGTAPARVDGACQIMWACEVPEASHDTQQAEPVAQATLATLAPAGLERRQDEVGITHAIPATLENGYDSEAAGEAWETWGCDPYLATGRPQHPVPQAEAPERPSTAQERMAATVRTPEGKALYARRQGMAAPVCGQSKAARGFRRFLRRGLENIRGAWRLVCLTHTLLKMWRYGGVLSAVSAVWRPVYGREIALRRASWRCGAALAWQRHGDGQGSNPSGRALDMRHSYHRHVMNALQHGRLFTGFRWRKSTVYLSV